jgi:hypothetical protein
MTVSFERDIRPVFNQFKGQMMWRFDLTDYEQVKQNADRIWGRISVGPNDGPMPPPPFPPLSQAQIAAFNEWMCSGYPP